MALLDDVIDASGGLARWNSLSRFTLHLSVGGTLFSERRTCQRIQGRHRGGIDADAIGPLHRHHRRRTVRRVCSRTRSRSKAWMARCCGPGATRALLSRANGTHALADELHLVFFCGVQIWNYLTTPFLLAHPDVVVEELPPWQENSETWRRLRAQFPPGLISLASEQMFYFDANALQRRTDHDLLGAVSRTIRGLMRISAASWFRPFDAR